MKTPETISAAEMERMMKLQDVILKAMAKKITWMAAAEIAGISDRTMRRIKDRYEEFGYDGLFARRRRKPSILRIPMQVAEQVLTLYRDQYFEFSVLHFHEKLRKEHGIGVSYMGEASVARRRSGAAAEKARFSPPAATASALAGDAAAH